MSIETSSTEKNFCDYEKKCIKKGENPISHLSGNKLDCIVQAYFEMNHLKQLYRQGWLRRGIPKEKCESIADHIFGVATLALFISEQYYPELDSQKALKMALIHEVGEVYGGDITPSDNVSKEDKHEIELNSAETIFSKLPNGKQYLSLWEEFEEGISPEAKLVNQLDKLDCGIQAVIYKKQGHNRMDEFINNNKKRLELDELINVMESLDNLAD